MIGGRSGAVAFVVVAALALGAPARADDPVTPPPLSAVADTYDAGRVAIGTRVTHTYELRNRGPRDLQLSVTTSCGCTTTDFDAVVPAGGTGKVSAALDTTHVRGRVVKSIRVKTNDPAEPAITLTLIAETIRLLDVLPSEQPILRGPVGALTPLELTVTAPDGAPFEIVRVEDDPLLAANVQPVDPATDSPPRGHQRYRVTLTPKADLAVGNHATTVTLVTTRPRAERFVLRPTVVVSGPLVAMPPQLHVGSAAAPVTVHITAARADATFRVLGARSRDADFRAQVAEVEDGHAWTVTLRYVGTPERRGPIDGVLEITTDEPSQPLVIVRFSGHL